jgi:hypothetical protein
MFDLNNNKKEFNLPSYINIPFFLYQDHRLDRPDLLIAAFFYSLHTAGKKLTASTDYLCQLAGIKKRQFYRIINLLETCRYIQRKGFTNLKKVTWIHTPGSNIKMTENEQIDEKQNASAPQDTSVEELTTSVTEDTKLVSCKTLNLCHARHTDIKEDTKDNKKLTTVNEAPSIVDKNPSSSSFFSEKQKAELLTYKLSTDERSDELFLDNCNHHAEKQTNALSKFQRFTGLKHILVKLYEIGEHFNASGFNKNQVNKEMDNKIPNQEDFNNYKKCVSGYEWVGSWMQKQRG